MLWAPARTWPVTKSLGLIGHQSVQSTGNRTLAPATGVCYIAPGHENDPACFGSEIKRSKRL